MKPNKRESTQSSPIISDIEIWLLRLHNEPKLWNVKQALKNIQKSLEDFIQEEITKAEERGRKENDNKWVHAIPDEDGSYINFIKEKTEQELLEEIKDWIHNGEMDGFEINAVLEYLNKLK